MQFFIVDASEQSTHYRRNSQGIPGFHRRCIAWHTCAVSACQEAAAAVRFVRAQALAASATCCKIQLSQKRKKYARIHVLEPFSPRPPARRRGTNCSGDAVISGSLAPFFGALGAAVAAMASSKSTTSALFFGVESFSVASALAHRWQTPHQEAFGLALLA